MNPYSLGIYFGSKNIAVIQTKSNKIISYIKIPNVTSKDELEEKVPDEVKIVAVLKDELRRNKIAIEEANVSLILSGKDLIVRTYEMPILSREELESAVFFEAKKYIPFRIEDLIMDYQIIYDKSSQKNLVLLVAIKKDILNKYLAVFNQLNQELTTLEFSAFSLLKLLKLSGIKQKGVTAFVNADLLEEDEVNFMVLQDGFPLFCRDIILSGETAGETSTISQGEPEGLIDMLKGELRVSLDFYKRKFPTKNIKDIIFIAPEESKSDLISFFTEREFTSHFVETKKYLSGILPYSISLLKAFCGSLIKLKTNIRINILERKLKEKIHKETEAPEKFVFLEGLKLDPKVVVVSLLICILTFVFGVYQRLPLQKQISEIIKVRPQITTVGNQTSYEELSAISAKSRERLNSITNLLNQQLYLSEQLNAIPKLIREGVWLTDFVFVKNEKKIDLTLTGVAYLGKSEEEQKAVTGFLTGLRESISFKKYFFDIKLSSLNNKKIENTTVTEFIITCTN